MLLGELPQLLSSDSTNSLLESRDLFIDIIVSPEKIDDHACDKSLASRFIESNYYSA